MFLKILMICGSKCFLRVSYFSTNSQKIVENRRKRHKKRNMFLRFQRIALDVSYGFGRNRSMFLIVVFLIKKRRVVFFWRKLYFLCQKVAFFAMFSKMKENVLPAFVWNSRVCLNRSMKRHNRNKKVFRINVKYH